MITSRPMNPRLVALCCLTAFASQACEDVNHRDPLPDWGDGLQDDAPTLDDAGVPVDEPPDEVVASNFALEMPLDLTYPHRLHRRGSKDACAVSPDQLPKKAGDPAVMDCILDIHELDLWVLGLEFEVVVPEGLCDFVEVHHYLYQNFEVGLGPDSVSYAIDEDGNFTDEVNAFRGKPQCVAYDHSLSNPEAPNCCIGSYQETVKNLKTGETSTRTGSWLGDDKLGDCYGGSGYRFQEVSLTRDGFPANPIYYTNREAFRHRMVYEGLSEDFPKTNIPLANFTDPAHHGGQLPAPLRGALTQPYYEVVCDDDAEEEYAVIRLQVREWNEVPQFKRDPEGDPDTKGMQDTRIPVNDMTDWRDLGAEPPFPRIPRPGIGG